MTARFQHVRQTVLIVDVGPAADPAVTEAEYDLAQEPASAKSRDATSLSQSFRGVLRVPARFPVRVQASGEETGLVLPGLFEEVCDLGNIRIVHTFV